MFAGSVCVCVCVCVLRGVGGGRICFITLRGLVGGEYRSLISTDGFVNLQEGPLRFALSVCQSDQFRRNVVCLCVCVCVGWVVGQGCREECVQSGCLVLYRLKWRSMRNHRTRMAVLYVTGIQ
jgi:hypothetical protein